MINMWSNWQRMIRAGTMLEETLEASRAVLGHRQTTIGAAIGDPLGADHEELSRMVSEKAVAFGAAGHELSKTWWTMQRDLAAQWSDMSSIMLGRMPGPRKALAMAARGERLSRAALSGSVRAMTPIHRTVTANARRLGRD